MSLPQCTTTRSSAFFLLTLTVVFILVATAQVQAQTPFNSTPTPEILAEIMPGMDRFAEKEGDPPVIRAYRRDAESGAEVLSGYVFLTSDLPPEEIGYNSTITVLVGMDLRGQLTGIRIMDYRESFRSVRGDFLTERGFQPQFKGKMLSEGFRVGRDINGVSRATLSSWAVARGVHRSATRVAQAYLSNIDGVAQDWSENVREHMAPLSWQDMLDRQWIRTMVVTHPDESELHLSFIYMGTEILGELLVGSANYSLAERLASTRFENGHLLLVAIGGNASQPLRQENLSVQQGDTFYPMPRRHYVYAGAADEAKIVGHAQYAGGLVLDAGMDLNQPFTINYDLPGTEQRFSVDYQFEDILLDLALGNPVLSLAEMELALLDSMQSSGFTALAQNAPWGKLSALVLLLSLVMLAFLRKSSRLRWLALTGTLFYLGFVDGGFLSVSHLSNSISMGPSLYSGDLPVMVIIIFTLLTTLIWGRIFCSSACPFGAVQDFIARFKPKRFQLPKQWQQKTPRWLHERALGLKYVILGFVLLMALVQSDISVFQYFEPFGTLFYFSPSLLLWLILAAILLGCLLVTRFYCRYLCPLGAALGVLSLLSPLRIKRVPQCSLCKVCEHACPTGAINGADIDFKECVRCDICESKLISQAGVCRHSMEKVSSRHKDWQAVKIVDPAVS